MAVLPPSPFLLQGKAPASPHSSKRASVDGRRKHAKVEGVEGVCAGGSFSEESEVFSEGSLVFSQGSKENVSEQVHAFAMATCL